MLQKRCLREEVAKRELSIDFSVCIQLKIHIFGHEPLKSVKSKLFLANKKDILHYFL